MKSFIIFWKKTKPFRRGSLHCALWKAGQLLMHAA